MFVEATPGSDLSKEFKTILNSCKINIKVVKRTGYPIRSEYRSVVVVCAQQNQMSTTRESVYKISCAGCHVFYIGETSRSVEQRHEGHNLEVEIKVQCSIHTSEKNMGGGQQILKLEVMKTCPVLELLKCGEKTKYEILWN